MAILDNLVLIQFNCTINYNTRRALGGAHVPLTKVF